MVFVIAAESCHGKMMHAWLATGCMICFDRQPSQELCDIILYSQYNYNPFMVGKQLVV